jgi:D-amino-acid oxidase
MASAGRPCSSNAKIDKEKRCWAKQHSTKDTYAAPRASDGGIILGGVSQPSHAQTSPDRSLRPDILTCVNTVTGGQFEWVDLEKHGEDIVGFRPAREGGLRVEKEGDVVHAYGIGGLGYMYAVGVAEKVTRLIGRVKRQGCDVT